MYMYVSSSNELARVSNSLVSRDEKQTQNQATDQAAYNIGLRGCNFQEEEVPQPPIYTSPRVILPSNRILHL